MNYKTGIKRSLILLLSITLLFSIIYYFGDIYILSRRKLLFTIEIIIYLVITNVFTIFLAFYLYRAVQWVVGGFKDGQDKG